MTSDSHPIPPFPAMRSAITLLVLMLSLALMTAGVLIATEMSQHILPALTSAAVCTLGALVTIELIRRGAKQSAQRVLMMSMAGTTVRLGVTLLGGCVLVFFIGMQVKTTVSWLLLWYILLLVAEVRMVAKYMASLSGDPSAGGLEIAEGR